MNGYIYVITNKINNKQYVGKTTTSIKERFASHIRDSKRERCEKRPLYSAMNKYGSNNFIIELLEECDLSILSERESFWINKLNTYHNGYNATLGGDGKILYDYTAIAEDYENGLLVKEISAKYGCDKEVVERAVRLNGHFNSSGNRYKRDQKKVAQYDKNNNFIQKFDSQKQAAEYLISQGSKGKISSISTNIGRVVKGQRKTAEGYIWKACD